jgi:hypothetical protein
MPFLVYSAAPPLIVSLPLNHNWKIVHIDYASLGAAQRVKSTLKRGSAEIRVNDRHKEEGCKVLT